MGSLRVIVAGYEPIYRAGLCTVLPTSDPSGRVAVVAEAGELERAVRLVRLLRPDVVITDLAFPEGQFQAAQKLLGENRRSSLLVVAEPHQLGDDLGALGVSGCVIRPARKSDLLDAMDAIAAGRRYIDPRLTARISPPSNRSNVLLTEREAEILQLLAFGYTNAEIARHLVISVRTAESHRSNIQRKLGVRTRADLARAAWREGHAASVGLELSPA